MNETNVKKEPKDFPALEDDHCIVRVLKHCCPDVVVVRILKTFTVFDYFEFVVLGAITLNFYRV